MNIKRMLSLVLSLIMLLGICVIGVSPAEAGLPFTDVAKKHWAYSAIEYVYEKGLMYGTGKGDTFSPSMNLSRAMVVTVLYRNDGSPKTEFQYIFDDVEDGQYYSLAAVWAYKNGIVSGTGEGEFGPLFSANRDITRQELAQMFTKYAEYKHVDTTKNTKGISDFKDAKNVANWAKKSMEWAVGAGLLSGKAKGDDVLLAPKDKATRAEFARIIKNYNDNAMSFSYFLAYEAPVPKSQYTEPDYPLVTDADIYVSLDGDDNNSGKLDSPLRTFEAAKAKVAEIKKTKTSGEIKVAFKGGDYGSLENINFTEADGGNDNLKITYCAYGDSEVYFTGGAYIKKSQFKSLTDAEKSLFPQDAVKSIKKIDLSGFDFADKLGSSLTLYSDNGFCDLARYPDRNASNNGFISGNIVQQIPLPGHTHEELMEIATTTGDQGLLATMTEQKKIKAEFMFKQRLDTYKSFDGVKIVGNISKVWHSDMLDVESYDKATGIISFKQSPTHGFCNYDEKYASVYISGSSEDLDCDGEYWYDPNTKTLYVYKPGNNYYVATDGTFIKGTNSDNLSFVNLNFRCNLASPFNFYRCDNLTIDRCSVSYTNGNDGIVINECLGVSFINNDVSFTSGYGIRFNGVGVGTRNDEGYDYMALMSQDILVENNLFHDVALIDIHSDVAAIKLADNVVGAKIRHNEVYNSSRHAVSFGKTSFDVLIEYNYFHDCMKRSADGGVIHNGRGVVGPTNVIRYNIFRDIVAEMQGGTYGVYLDDYETDTEVYGNIFYNVATPVVTNCGRDNNIHDNVSISTGNFFINFNPDRALEEMTDPSGEIYVQYANILPKPDSPYYDIWFDRCPSNYAVEFDTENKLNPNSAYVQNNTVVNNLFFDCGDIKFDEDVETVCTILNNRDMSIDENVCFGSPTHGDYSITDTSVIADNHFDLIGRY